MKRDPLPLSLGAASPARVAQWHRALIALGAALLAIVALFWSTGASMVGIWTNSETFAHGFVVAPISLWLIWRMRARLRELDPHPSWGAVPLVACAGAVWLVGAAGEVNALMQAAFVAMIVLATAAILGLRVARRMMFPLGFLFFAVPLGDFLLPTLMDRTADFTVFALRASGVPVYREGLMMVLPTGRWSIIEACSGVRYLIASLMVGTLFAYISYTAYWRRLVFVAVSIVVPIVANWVRAYLIVLLGHLSNNRLATGVDHIIYGWIFFGFVMLLMFWIGARWKEPSTARAASSPAVAEGAPVAAAWFRLAAFAVVATALVWPLADAATQPAQLAPVALGGVEVPGWQSLAAHGGFTPQFKGASATVEQAFGQKDAVVGLYVAYYRGQDSHRKVVSSENVLVHSEDSTWLKVGDASREALIGDSAHKVRVARLKTRGERAIVAWRWYWIDGALTSSDALAKARLAWSRLRGRGDDAAAIVIYADDARAHSAERTLQAFARDAWPPLSAALVAARAQR